MSKASKTLNKTPYELAESLGLAPSDAIEWEVRHSLTQKIIQTFDKSSYTVTQIAKDSGTSRARVTKILKDDMSDHTNNTTVFKVYSLA